MPRNAKRKALRRGALAEAAAAGLLRLKGYRIVARRFRVAQGEIDIVARRGGVLVFVEVKARDEIADAALAIRPRQADRIVRAARAFVQARPRLAGLDQRFDAVLVGRWRLPVHLEDAWRPEG